MENRTGKLDNESIDKIKTLVEKANIFLNENSMEELQLSIVREFPEITFTGGDVIRVTI